VTFTYTIRDSFGATDSATVTVDVAANTGVPVAVDDSTTTSQNTATNIGTGVLLTNDTDPDAGDTLTVTAVDGTASQGTATLAGALVTYTPATDFVGTDTFTYTVSDSAGNTATGTVSVTVTDQGNGGGNAPTIGSFTSGTTDATVGTPVTFTYNFANPETGPFTCTFNPGGTGTAGAGLSGTTAPYTVTNCAGQGSVTFTYDSAGNPTVTFTAQNSGGSSSETVNLTVTTGGGGANTAPTATADSATTDQDLAVTVDVLANDSDSDGNLVPSSVVVTSQPSNGTTNINTTTGAITYTPAAGFTGQDSFAYTVSDDDGASSAAATVTVTVEATTGNETINLTSDCGTASNVGDTCTVTVNLAGNAADYGFVGITFSIANPNFQLNSAQAAGITAGGTAGVGQNNRTVAIITLAGNLIDPQENGVVATVVFERTQAGTSTFTVSGGELGANAADSGASDVVISGTFTLDIP
jgi:hypothetical protein